jgi:CheY-like chemotaxis protein
VEKPFVLVVDDNEATCTLITALLQNDFVVEVVNDGREALTKLESRQYSAILLDLLMPITDGYAVLDFLRERNSEMLRKTIVVTASLAARELDRVKKYEVCGVIAKPFEVDTLYGAVRQCVGESGPQFIRGPLLSSGVILLLAEVGRALKL